MQEPERFVAACWDDRCVVFNRHLGSTHALDELTTAVWRLPPSERNIPSAIASLSSFYAEASSEELSTAIDSAFAQLRNIGML